MTGIFSKIVCALGALSLWLSFGGFIYCKVYARKKAGAVWTLSKVLFIMFFFFLAVWCVLRNIDMPAWNLA